MATTATTDSRIPDAQSERSLPAPRGILAALRGRWQVYRRWWRMTVLETVDQAAVIAKRREEAYLSPRYLFMLAMSAGIAIVGLLQSSQAVVIGAMLIAPLMGPIIGGGFALAIGDYKWLRGSFRALVAGTVLGVALTALIVFLSPLKTMTPEIAARTQPNLFDLAVAVFSALAGAYSMIRGREGTIVGVAIATALMPPLAVVGFGLATANWIAFSGALLLFVTNLVTIALVATIMARIYGFSARLSGKQTRWQTAIIIAIFAALAVPLAFSLRQIAWESNAARIIRSSLLAEVGDQARLSQLEFDLQTEPVQVTATVLTPGPQDGAESRSAATLAARLERPVDLSLTQFRVDTEAQAEAAELLASQSASRQALSQQSRAVAERIALVAGVDPADVLVDREARRAAVRARPLPGTTLAAYRELEARVQAQAGEWSVRIEPPLLPLPAIAFADGELTEAGRESLALIGWAAARRGQGVTLTGGSPATREIAADVLANSGVTATGRVGGATMTADWTAATPMADPDG